MLHFVKTSHFYGLLDVILALLTKLKNFSPVGDSA
jgi:hypothetical protein